MQTISILLFLLISQKDTHLICRRPESKFHFLFLLSFSLNLARQFLQIVFAFCPWNWECNAKNVKLERLPWDPVNHLVPCPLLGKCARKKKRGGAKALTNVAKTHNLISEVTHSICQRCIIQSDQ